MPNAIRGHKGHGGKKCYSVVNRNTGHKHAKCTTKAKAVKQERLLRAVEHGWHPTHKR